MKEGRFKVGVVGHPIKHSLSAVMHNAAFRELGIPQSYSAYDVPPTQLKSFIDNCKKDFLGLNVTIPHKVEVIKYLDSVSREANLIGAVNTIKFEGGQAVGYNTDGVGCVKALKAEGVEVKNKRVFVLGSGGAARAIILSCLLEGAKVSNANRSREKAVALREEFRKKTGKTVEVVSYSEFGLRDELLEADILINATSVGMTPNINESPVSFNALRSGLVVMDIVYNPLETKLLRDAKRIGCKTISGVGMLVFQGAESEKIWYGVDPPIKTMTEAVLRELK